MPSGALIEGSGVSEVPRFLTLDREGKVRDDFADGDLDAPLRRLLTCRMIPGGFALDLHD